uniref:Mitochondrial resolvase Ydc2 catalytic domain-containing protein n=1 Tax=viral metagenome TaxID=1070528 RepID=A0A6C0ACB1_9ZZZZ
MKLLSIDVGLINLAYCILEDNTDNNNYNNNDKEKKDNKNNKFTIIDWGLIDVSEKVDTCDKCDKPAKFKNDLKNVKFCGVHKRKYNNEFTEEGLYTKLEEKDICTQCGKTGYYKLNENDTIMCSSHKTSHLKKESKKYNLEQIKKQSVMKTDINVLCEKIAKKLDEKDFPKVDKVVIENQPSVKNGKMKSVQTFISCYFVIRFNIDKKYNTQICFSLANNKLKYDKETTKKELSKAKNAREKYTITKELGVKYAKQLLDKDKVKNNKWIELLDNNKKKQDDLADSLMQGYYFMFIK